ncbi:hypothetical protein, partial [Kitasatospora nipponensis]
LDRRHRSSSGAEKSYAYTGHNFLATQTTRQGEHSLTERTECGVLAGKSFDDQPANWLRRAGW